MRSDPALKEVEEQWLAGGSALPLARRLAQTGACDEAAAVARLALSRPNCADARELELLLDELAAVPEGWAGSLASFARAPSLESWRALMQFVPPEQLYLTQRDAIRRLRKLGVDGDTLFLCATELGITPDAFELVEEGLASVSAILDRAARTGGARCTYVGLAAEAAFVSGDLMGSVRLLREAMALETELVSAAPHVFAIRERATPEQNEMLDRAGIPPE